MVEASAEYSVRRRKYLQNTFSGGQSPRKYDPSSALQHTQIVL